MGIYDIGLLDEKLKGSTYPGRGIMLGVTPDGLRTAAVYFIMGRSSNSRNRIFKEEMDGISTEAFDPSLVEDPSLIIYHPVRESAAGLIVTNGDQTDTILTALSCGGTFEGALRTREFEPDSPNWTPRISGLLAPDGSYKLSILKSADTAGSACVREFFEFPGIKGTGHFIHTYNGDGNPLPTFTGEPETVRTDDDMDAFTDRIWDALNHDNRISLFVRYTDINDGSCEQIVINANGD